MDRALAVLLLAGCATLQGWAQVPSAQSSTQPTPATEQQSQKSADQNPDQNHPPQPTPDNHTPASPGEPATAPAQTGFPLDKFQEFSAIMTGGPVSLSDWDGHIYRSGNLMRMEGPNSRNYLITNLAKRETHGMTALGCAQYSYVYSRSFPFYLSGSGEKYESVPVGEETVDGHACRVEDITITSPKPPSPLTIRLWEAEDLQGFPIKIETRGRFHHDMQYKNVVLGPQDPTIFIYPTECQVLNPGKMTKLPNKAPAANPK